MLAVIDNGDATTQNWADSWKRITFFHCSLNARLVFLDSNQAKALDAKLNSPNFIPAGVEAITRTSRNLPGCIRQVS